MPDKTFFIKTFSGRRSRVISTVLDRIQSSKYNFVRDDEIGSLSPQIAIFDAQDVHMRGCLAATLECIPDLKVLYIVNGLELPLAQRYEIKGTELVYHLIPALERIADAICSHTPQLALGPARDNKVLHLVPRKPRRTRLSALVVDDNATVRMQVSKAIEQMGLNCDTVDSGAAALAILATQTYDVIFVDIVMPDMDGYQLTRAVKRHTAHKSTPVIILTSKSSTFDRARGALVGCDAYLTKPVELKRLFEATVQCLTKTMAILDLAGLIRDPSAPAFADSQRSLLDAKMATAQYAVAPKINHAFKPA